MRDLVRNLPEFLDIIREITHQGLVDIMLMSAYVNEQLSIKEGLFRFVDRVGEEVQSGAVKADAWHHRSDAITSTAAFIGSSIALIGCKGYEAADNWASLAAACLAE